jgi:hypothetical protein
MRTLLRITPAAKNGWSSVLAEAALAEPLHRHFRSLHLSATPIQDAVVPTVRVDQDGNGTPHVITEALDRAFDVQAIPNALAITVGHWLKTQR